MANKVHATAKVRVSFDLTLPQGWGDDCPMSQVQKQTSDEARDALTKILDLLHQHKSSLAGQLSNPTVYPDIVIKLTEKTG